MTPLREVKPLTTRYEQDIEEIEPFRRYYLIFEGENTEVLYFSCIQDYKREIGIHNLIKLVVLQKDGDIRSHSDPKRLFILLTDKKHELQKNGEAFDNDQFVIVFDRDSFGSENEYIDFISEAGKENILMITSPCFELWLILHFEEAIRKYIIPNEEEIIINKPISRQHSFTSGLFSSIANMNPKKKPNFNGLIQNIDLACEQERDLEQNINNLFTKVGSNISKLITELKLDPRKSFYDSHS